MQVDLRMIKAIEYLKKMLFATHDYSQNLFSCPGMKEFKAGKAVRIPHALPQSFHRLRNKITFFSLTTNKRDAKQ